ncbi:MAG: hypothetical protein AB8B65_11960 [Kordia sp.]|uniref:hypothetical protein n=1 Tax=Kordia sp. TaxID=1965332 RepID=UPI003859581D
MHAYEYGLEKYGKKFQPSGNVVVFNDRITLDDGSNNPDDQSIENLNIPTDFDLSIDEYMYCELKSIPGSSQFNFTHGSRSNLNRYTVENYLIPSGQMRFLRSDTVTFNNGNSIDVYTYYLDGKYYGRFISSDLLTFLYPQVFVSGTSTNSFSDNFNEALNLYSIDYAAAATPKFTKNLSKISKPKAFGSLEVILNKFYKNSNVSVMFFISKDGAKIEKSHIDIDEIRDNEIIIFLEEDDSYNILGSVCRVLSGKNIGNSKQFSSEGIAILARLFDVDTNTGEIKSVAVEHIEKKKKGEEWGILYFLGKIVDAVVGFGTWLIKETFGDGLIAIGEGITSLKFGENRWKYYDDKGQKNPKFNPIFPGLETIIDLLLDTKEASTKEYDPSKQKSNNSKDPSFEGTTSDIRTNFNKFIGYIPHKRISNYLKDKLSFIIDIIETLVDLYNQIVKFINEGFAGTLIFLNALVIGILNSLIEAVGDIFSMVGMILSLPYHLHKIYSKQKKGSYVSLVVELLENAVEGFVNLFSIKNLNAVIDFTVASFSLVKNALSNPETIVSKLKQANEFVKTNVDEIGYTMGYIIGFVVEEVFTGLISFGIGNLIKNGKKVTKATEAFDTSSDSLQRVLTTKSKRPDFEIKDSNRFVNTIIELFNKIKNFDLKKALDTLLEWIREFVSTTKELAENAFIKLFPNKKVRDTIISEGFIPTKVNAAGNAITFCPIK